MFKKLNFSSPIGIALTVAGVLVALSPEARRAVRKLMVKGTAGVMDAVEHVGGMATGAAGALSERAMTWKSDDRDVAHPVSNAVETQELAFEAGSVEAQTETQTPTQAETQSRTHSGDDFH